MGDAAELDIAERLKYAGGLCVPRCQTDVPARRPPDDETLKTARESGQVVGSADLPSGYEHALLWSERDGMVDLGTLGGLASRADDISDAGHIVGNSLQLLSPCCPHAFLNSYSAVSMGRGGGYAVRFRPAGDDDHSPARLA